MQIPLKIEADDTNPEVTSINESVQQGLDQKNDMTRCDVVISYDGKSEDCEKIKNFIAAFKKKADERLSNTVLTHTLSSKDEMLSKIQSYIDECNSAQGRIMFINFDTGGGVLLTRKHLALLKGADESNLILVKVTIPKEGANWKLSVPKDCDAKLPMLKSLLKDSIITVNQSREESLEGREDVENIESTVTTELFKDKEEVKPAKLGFISSIQRCSTPASLQTLTQRTLETISEIYSGSEYSEKQKNFEKVLSEFTSSVRKNFDACVGDISFSAVNGGKAYTPKNQVDGVSEQPERDLASTEGTNDKPLSAKGFGKLTPSKVSGRLILVLCPSEKELRDLSNKLKPCVRAVVSNTNREGKRELVQKMNECKQIIRDGQKTDIIVISSVDCYDDSFADSFDAIFGYELKQSLADAPLHLMKEEDVASFKNLFHTAFSYERVIGVASE